MKMFCSSIQDFFPLFEQVLTDAYKTDVHLYTSPYHDISEIDRGFRKMLWGDTRTPKIFTEYLSNPERYRLAVIKSSLGFYSILASISLEKNHPDFITIGPFSQEKLSDSFISRKISDRSLTKEQAAAAKIFYDILPVADVYDVTAMVLHLLQKYIPEYLQVVPEYIDYSEETHGIFPNEDAFQNFSFAAAEYYAKYLKDFLDTLITGNYQKTSKYLKVFIDANGMTNIASLRTLRRKMTELNSLCKERFFHTTVHPYYVLQQAHYFELQIDAQSSREQLLKLPYEMARKYCLLIQNHGFSEYSYLIRNVMAYIDNHLEEELTLSSIATHFQKNASALSSRFSKETGTNITAYIRTTRIHTAIRYFNTTDFSISEIASAVGIHDFAYFSRLFIKEIGISPREYKKMLTNI